MASSIPHVRLMAEYSVDLPLWYSSPARMGPVPRGALGLSSELEQRLADWNTTFERAMGDTYDWPSADAHLEFLVAGWMLSAETQRELGDRVLLLREEDESKAAPAIPLGPVAVSPHPAATEETNRVVPVRAGSRYGSSMIISGAELVPRPSVEQQFRDMPDAEFDVLAAKIDVAQFRWSAEKKPSRLLLAPRAGALPLVDRSSLVGRPDDTASEPVADTASEPVADLTMCGASEPAASATVGATIEAAFSLSNQLVRALHAWSDRWLAVTRGDNEGGAPPVAFLVEGHELAAALQREVGADVTVLFPEASPRNCAPMPELRAFLSRMESRDSRR